MKKLLVLLLALALVFSFAACGQTEEAPVVEEQGEEATAPETVYTAKLGTIEPNGSPKMEAMTVFAEKVAEYTNGGVEIQIFPDEQLGSAREMIEATQLGTEEATLTTSSNLSTFCGAMSILDLPFLFENRDACYALIDSEWGDKYQAQLEKVGLKGVGIWESGFKQITVNFEYTGEISQLQNIKVRVMDNPVLIAQYEAMGDTATVINYGELYTSLQQGVVDGQENPLTSIYEMKFYEVQDTLIISDHGYLALLMCFNLDWFNALPAEYQEGVIKASHEASVFLRELQYANEFDTFVPEMEAAGIKVYYMTEEEKAALKDMTFDACREALLNLLDEEGVALLEEMEAAL